MPGYRKCSSTRTHENHVTAIRPFPQETNSIHGTDEIIPGNDGELSHEAATLMISYSVEVGIGAPRSLTLAK